MLQPIMGIMLPDVWITMRAASYAGSQEADPQGGEPRTLSSCVEKQH